MKILGWLFVVTLFVAACGGGSGDPASISSSGTTTTTLPVISKSEFEPTSGAIEPTINGSFSVQRNPQILLPMVKEVFTDIYGADAVSSRFVSHPLADANGNFAAGNRATFQFASSATLTAVLITIDMIEIPQSLDTGVYFKREYLGGDFPPNVITYDAFVARFNTKIK